MATTNRIELHSQPPRGSRPGGSALAAELGRRVRGEVRFSDGDRALYATDSSNYRQVPIGVVVPRDVDDVVETVAICRRFGAPILPRGGGTGLAGQTCNVAVVIDMSKYMRQILSIDPENRRARVRPGVVHDDVGDAIPDTHLVFGPDPATHRWCTFGGMIGNNSCGVHSQISGKTDQNVDELEILTYDGLRLRVGPTSDAELAHIIREGGRRGEIYGQLRALRDRYADEIRRRFPHIPRLVSGYALEQLLPENGFNVARALVGTEGTCVTVLEATVKLIRLPPHRALVILGYPDVYHAADHVPEILPFEPMGLEGLGETVVGIERVKRMFPEAVADLPEGNGWLMVEFGGDTPAEAAERAQEMIGALRRTPTPPPTFVATDRSLQAALWHVREAALGAGSQTLAGGKRWPGWEDSAVPPEKVGPYLQDLKRLFEQYRYSPAIYGHFGQGCIHIRIDFDLVTAEGIRKFDAFMHDAARLVVHYGGSLSGEHGDGQARAALYPIMFGEDLVRAFGEFKRIWDPEGKMNPGKVVDPYPITSNLRLGTDYNPPNPRTHFQFPEDRGSFARAALRCVGAGECRKLQSGTMCPSYMATLEEKHSTRGRARLLFEMLNGSELKGGWKNEAVRESLDLCLACKGCKGECPVQVDMATYKAEFLSHYYAGRFRPRSAYAFGLIMYWARLAQIAPGAVNFVTQTPLLRDLAKSLAGIHPARRIPTFAPQTFKEWFRRRPLKNLGGPKVILWADTFNNYFLPDTAKAAVEVLESAGLQVLVPEAHLCCGRPVYDFGMLDVGKRLLRQILDTLKPEIEAGVPIVGLEPSCVAVFRDELVALFPNDENAVRLSHQTFLFSEFLEKKIPGFPLPKLDGKAVVHGHCHHKALMGMEDEVSVLRRMGLDFRVLDDGCCGMAGGFGFEHDHYEVSVRVGERVLLPAVREAAPETLIVADGFSCREQIVQTTPRRSLHLAELIYQAMRSGQPHNSSSETEPPPSPLRRVARVVGGAALVGVGGYLLARGRKR